MTTFLQEQTAGLGSDDRHFLDRGEGSDKGRPRVYVSCSAERGFHS